MCSWVRMVVITEGCRTNGGIEILVDKRLTARKLGESGEGLMWVEYEVERRTKSGSRHVC